MKLITNHNGFDYYIGYTRIGVPFYKVVPEGQKPEEIGLFNKTSACEIRGVPDMFDLPPATIQEYLSGKFAVFNEAGCISMPFPTHEEAQKHAEFNGYKIVDQL